jgi:hypothetical protein
MTVSPLLTGFSQSPNYHQGRLRPIRMGVLHTIQCPTQPGRAKSTCLGTFANPNTDVSAHVSCDTSEAWGSVQEQDTAWCAPGANADGIHVEQAAFADYGSGAIAPSNKWFNFYGGRWPEWSDVAPQQMLNNVVIPLIRDISARNNLPFVVLEPADLLDPEARGWTDHIRCTRAFGGSHWDCGPGYPLYDVIAKAAGQTTVVNALKGKTMHVFNEGASSTTWIVRGDEKVRIQEILNYYGVAWDWNSVVLPALRELHVAGVLVTDPDAIPRLSSEAMLFIDNAPVVTS